MNITQLEHPAQQTIEVAPQRLKRMRTLLVIELGALEPYRLSVRLRVLKSCLMTAIKVIDLVVPPDGSQEGCNG